MYMTISKNMRLFVIMFALIMSLLASNQARASAGEQALRGCIEGSVTAAVLVWGAALLAAPVTAGASLVAAPKVHVVAESAGWGCAAGAGGRTLTYWLFGD